MGVGTGGGDIRGGQPPDWLAEEDLTDLPDTRHSSDSDDEVDGTGRRFFNRRKKAAERQNEIGSGRRRGTKDGGRYQARDRSEGRAEPGEEEGVRERSSSISQWPTPSPRVPSEDTGRRSRTDSYEFTPRRGSELQGFTPRRGSELQGVARTYEGQRRGTRDSGGGGHEEHGAGSRRHRTVSIDLAIDGRARRARQVEPITQEVDEAEEGYGASRRRRRRRADSVSEG